MDGKWNVRGRLYPLSMRVRWTRRERDMVRGRAAEAGRSVSRYLVESATREDGAALVDRLTPEQVAQLELLAFQVRKIGVNLNQLAHRGERGGLRDRRSAHRRGDSGRRARGASRVRAHHRRAGGR